MNACDACGARIQHAIIRRCSRCTALENHMAMAPVAAARILGSMDETGIHVMATGEVIFWTGMVVLGTLVAFGAFGVVAAIILI